MRNEITNPLFCSLISAPASESSLDKVRGIIGWNLHGIASEFIRQCISVGCKPALYVAIGDAEQGKVSTFVGNSG